MLPTVWPLWTNSRLLHKECGPQCGPLGGAERPTLCGGTNRNFLGGSTRYVGRIDPGRIDRGADRPAPNRDMAMAMLILFLCQVV